MLDGLLGRGFISKCELLIKLAKTRIDLLRKRQVDTQRFLKGNLRQLLAKGLYINAYGRIEEFIAVQNVLSCYDFIQRCCEYILRQISLIHKQRECPCPEECRESIGSLMFAAARFSNMPELRELRNLFQERYGTGLEQFVNHDFAEEMASISLTTEEKLQFLQGIALEFSIKWDCRDFQRETLELSVSSQDQPKRLEPISDPDKPKLANGKDTLSNSEKMIDSCKNEYNYLNDDRNGVHDSAEIGEMTTKEPRNRNVLKEELADKPDSYHSNARSPPYIKPRESKKNDDCALAPEKLRGCGCRCREKGLTYYDEVPLPKPRSMRKKQQCCQNGEDADIESSSSNSRTSRRRNKNNNSSSSSNSQHQQKYEDERVLDKLLLHYSRKPSDFDPEKFRKRPSSNNPVAANNEESRLRVEPVHPKLSDYER